MLKLLKSKQCFVHYHFKIIKNALFIATVVWKLRIILKNKFLQCEYWCYKRSRQSGHAVAPLSSATCGTVLMQPANSAFLFARKCNMNVEDERGHTTFTCVNLLPILYLVCYKKNWLVSNHTIFEEFAIPGVICTILVGIDFRFFSTSHHYLCYSNFTWNWITMMINLNILQDGKWRSC